jgi:succinate-semialdehyde dehydrogenase/glutarate-semialdehyde dehydrogenase
MIARRLKDPTLLETRGYVNGRWIDSTERFAVVDPATGLQMASVADMTIADTVSAIDFGSFGPVGRSATPSRLRHFATVFWLTP